ncbi:MAG: ABC transporter ATP-binding protein [Bacteroidetes bacterium RIFCSPLOWO2_12_FULL_37_12]|nr:MAG: ABC transporter ATP-binding protein [Bacteroidetes bacterium RIFCSPLOWO2_12_FULL_37_12]
MLSIQHVSKQFQSTTALNDVSFEIPSRCVFGLLGPNGAGKTTLIRIINQITGADSGEIVFNGEKLNRKQISQIGYLPEERGLYKKMKVGELLLYLAQLKDMEYSNAVKEVKFWFERLEIKSWWDKKIEDLSKGMQQKIQFIATVVHKPNLIILDEPFTGFDPVNTQLIMSEIMRLKNEGATIILSTHRMESVEEICERIVLINKSKKILEGEVRQIKKDFRTHTYQVEYESLNSLDIISNGFEVINHKETEPGFFSMEVKIKPPQSSNQFLQSLLLNATIHSFREAIPHLNDIFIKAVKEPV